jgi:hypothetical protein
LGSDQSGTNPTDNFSIGANSTATQVNPISFTGSGSFATVSYPLGYGLNIGDTIVISNCPTSGYNTTGSTVVDVNFSVGTTAASGTGTTATLTYNSNVYFSAGDTIVVSGVLPDGYNGTYTVTATPAANQVSYANTTTGAQSVAGTVRNSNRNIAKYANATSTNVSSGLGSCFLFNNITLSNGGFADIIIYRSPAPLPTGTGYGVGGYGAGGYGNGVVPPNPTSETTGNIWNRNRSHGNIRIDKLIQCWRFCNGIWRNAKRI